MNSLNSIEEPVKFLIDNPYSSYLLYILYTLGNDSELPMFINRAKEVNILRDLGLIEFTSIKHLHYKPTKLRKEGLKICKILSKIGIFTIFNEIPLESSYIFREHYYNRLKSLKNVFKYPDSEIYILLFSKIGKWQNPNNIEFKINEIIPLEIQDKNEILEIIYEINCIGCKNIVIQSIKINYDLYDSKMQPITIKCKICNEHYKICPYLNCLYSISKL